MRRYWAYLKYIIRHKWFVFQATLTIVHRCRDWNISPGMALSLLARGIRHDLSKFLPDEFVAYARYFYNPDGSGIPYDANRELDVVHAFDVAWLKHQHRNAHHWQHWVLREDSGEAKVLEMPWLDSLELLADWNGMSMARGKPNASEWYLRQKENGKILFHPFTQVFVEAFLGVLNEHRQNPH